ncbi:translation initiation factor IF-2 [Thiothrix nivea]|uniref:Translation initiation factor IF-2 n=1 Tax=Thiothrix nivea (strain ATCC 35100 / DSM 5205 / JP2) TaxID=870187 RepID=A0A656HEY4_THINJ|nr:translation initiation factor IF-2 [Thiothrix nivea]EIJ34036.1 translation initiation factor IF-2 [Thiothrix nivea DSM 5205]
MSDIAVKKLAEIVNAPVEVLLKQLQDAGIHVDGPDAWITDAQKLTLLAHIRQGASAAPAGGGSKITLKRRSTSEMTVGPGTRGKTVSVEVRRKKTISTDTDKPAGSGGQTFAPEARTSRTEELARQMAAERKAREALIQKAEQERRQRETQRFEQQRQAVAEPAAQEEELPAVPQIEEHAEPISAPAVEMASEATVMTDAPAQEQSVGGADETATTTETVPTTEAPTETVPATEAAAAEPAVGENLSAREQREAVAAAAREEAAAALKRRPSKAKPKQSLAPRQVADSSAPEPEQEASTDKYSESDRSGDKKSVKKVVKKVGGRSREELHVPAGNRAGKKKGGRREVSKPDLRQQAKHGFEKPTAPVIREIEIPPTIIVSDLAQKLAIRATEIIKAMMKMGMMVTINQSIDQDTAILVTEELGHKAKPMQEMDDASMLAAMIDQDAEYEESPRPPVVTIMGHVDHGKTSLLDYIRETRVAAGEAGGITQHIGAYHVDTDHGTVTFLDTPGHAAFTKMRARGAQVTDIVILIVAADDGVMPQTKEAIQHAKAAGVPLVVAINKIDKPAADPERVLSELSQNGVLTEEWGGDVPVARVSAKTGQGIDELLETLLLVAEVQELRAPVEAPAQGNVIEASIEKGRGAVATILVRKGTLQKGDLLLCGTEYGRVRAMFDERGRPVKEAGPSIPVSVLGLSAAPEAGDEVVVLTDERKAKEIAELRREKQRDSRFAAQSSAKLDNLFSQMQAGTRAQVNLLVKADVQGSVEAIRSELLQLSTDEVEVRVLSSGVGGINESDVDLAAASKAIIVAFNVRADATARKSASDEGVEIRYYSIIYDVLNDVKEAMSGLLSPEVREVFVGIAEVRDVFRASGFGQVAGCLVVDGSVKRGNPIRVLRDNVVIFEGELESLRRHRDDVKEVPMGTECGIAIKDYTDVRKGDQIECYERIEVARKL